MTHIPSWACGWTIMHMTGYGQSVYNWPMFLDALREGACKATLRWMAEYHVKLWGSTDDIEEIMQGLARDAL